MCDRKDPDARDAAAGLLDNLAGAVGAAVVYDQHFPGERAGSQVGCDLIQRAAYARLLVVGRDDYGEVGLVQGDGR